jgi:hypothetical protein
MGVRAGLDVVLRGDPICESGQPDGSRTISASLETTWHSSRSGGRMGR